MIALRKQAEGALNSGAAPRPVNAVETRLTKREPPYAGNNSCESRLPAALEAREKEKERLPESFDELAIYLDQEFGRLAAEFEQMVKGLREAEMRSEQLRHRLLDGRSS